VPLPPQPTYGRKKPANSRAKRPAADIALQNQSVTSEEQKKRSSDHRAKWMAIKMLQNNQHTLRRPRSLQELRRLSPEAILQPEGGFETLSGFQLAVSEHCAREEKAVTSSKGKTVSSLARRNNGLPLGVSDRNHCRFVCSGDNTGRCLFEADAWCRGYKSGDYRWVCENFHPHTCDWAPAYSKSEKKRTHLESQIVEVNNLVQNTTQLNAMSTSHATRVAGLQHANTKLAKLNSQLQALGPSVGRQTTKYRPYTQTQLARGLLDQVHSSEPPSIDQALEHIKTMTGKTEDTRYASETEDRGTEGYTSYASLDDVYLM
jgi:hypothetical protein